MAHLRPNSATFSIKVCNIQSFTLESLDSLFLISCYGDVKEMAQLLELFSEHPS